MNERNYRRFKALILIQLETIDVLYKEGYMSANDAAEALVMVNRLIDRLDLMRFACDLN